MRKTFVICEKCCEEKAFLLTCLSHVVQQLQTSSSGMDIGYAFANIFSKPINWRLDNRLKSSFRYDSQLQQIDGTLSTIEMQREALEGANTNTAVLTTMNDAAKALKKANNELDVDKV